MICLVYKVVSFLSYWYVDGVESLETVSYLSNLQYDPFVLSPLQKLFKEAIDDGTMEGFFKLISYFQTQSEPAYCGLASLSMVLNALAIDPGRKWKGKSYYYAL